MLLFVEEFEIGNVRKRHHDVEVLAVVETVVREILVRPDTAFGDRDRKLEKNLVSLREVKG